MGSSWRRELRLLTLDAVIATIGLMLINPKFYLLFQLLTTGSITETDGALKYYVTFALITIVLVSALAFSCIAVFRYCVSKLYLDKNVWALRYTSDSYKDLKIKVKTITAKKLLATSRLELYGRKKDLKIIYRMLEDKSYVLPSNVFNINTKYRLIPIMIATLMLNGAMYQFTDSSILVSVLHSLAILTLMIGSEVAFSLISVKNQNKKIERVVNESPVSNIRTVCEYDYILRAVRNSDNEGYFSFDGITIMDLAKDKRAAHPKILSAITALELLIKNSYYSIHILNENDDYAVNKVSEDKRKEDINTLLFITTDYIPNSIKQIKNSFDVSGLAGLYSKGSDDELRAVQQSDVDMVKAYDEFIEDISNQQAVVMDIHNYYNKVTQDKVLNGFRSIIETQPKDWKEEIIKQSYSAKTKVLNKNLNEKVIPQLKALMVGVDDETKLKIEIRIEEISKFFKEQVALDRQDEKALELDYDRAVEIKTDNGLVPEKDAIDVHLRNIDFYVEELKKNW